MKSRVERYVAFFNAGLSPSGVTKRWNVRNTRTNETIGAIKWYGGWRKYCFFSADVAMYDSDCLELIAQFINEKMLERKYELERTKK